ncbi:TetR/AcrR family transcriptional regulator [Rhodococcus opacus]|uniref:TetR/AcrR family transcriptional regulator n=1 Tax=Rhodococcus opacus TaxID=37919 RepID=UPI0027DF1898|nr:helix-turn-helix domain-containing protein [Rhodococcus opacus]
MSTKPPGRVADKDSRLLERPTRKSTEARTRIIRVAEQLFAEGGIASVSLREISSNAGFANNNAVQYHFGDKDALVRAVFEYRYRPLDDERRRLLAELPDHPTADDIIATTARCLVLPAATLLDDPEGSFHLRFAAQLYQQPDHNILTTTGDLWRELFGGSDSVVRSVFRLVETHFTDIDKDVLILRERFASALVTNAMSAREAAEQNFPRDLRASRDVFVAELLRSVRMLLAADP